MSDPSEAQEQVPQVPQPGVIQEVVAPDAQNNSGQLEVFLIFAIPYYLKSVFFYLRSSRSACTWSIFLYPYPFLS